jgi:hypothetical protein
LAKGVVLFICWKYSKKKPTRLNEKL